MNEIVVRARSLAGATVGALAARLGRSAPGGGASTKGRVGELVEVALGATGGSGARVVDFPEHRLELKTIPVTSDLRPHESTFVCAVDLRDEVDWPEAWVRAKLSKVLFVPVIGERTTPLARRTLGEPVYWEMSAAQEEILRADYDDIMGLVGVGRVEEISAHLGRYLQIRPKARDGNVRTVARGPEGEPIPTVPRGFYLRPSFTRALLLDPTATP